jgi:hypothetical protein
LARNSLLSDEEPEIANFKLDLQAFFKCSTVFNLLPLSGRVIVIDSRCSLMAAWTALAINDIAAAAVWNNAHNNFEGAFSLSDLATIICRHCSSPSFAPPPSDSPASLDSLNNFSALQQIPLSDYMLQKGEQLDMSPNDTIFNICSLMQARRCRFLPIIERDEEGGSCHAVQVWV